MGRTIPWWWNAALGVFLWLVNLRTWLRHYAGAVYTVNNITKVEALRFLKFLLPLLDFWREGDTCSRSPVKLSSPTNSSVLAELLLLTGGFGQVIDCQLKLYAMHIKQVSLSFALWPLPVHLASLWRCREARPPVHLYINPSPAYTGVKVQLWIASPPAASLWINHTHTILLLLFSCILGNYSWISELSRPDCHWAL